MNINPTDQVLHLSFDDEAYARADAFCGKFNKRQIANKTFKPIEFNALKLPFKDKSFDVVYSVNTLAYTAQPLAMFDEIRRISKRAYLKERSEFAEMIFGWPDTRWIIDVENRQFIFKSKNDLKISRFGPFFHHLYATDPVFFDYCSQNPGILNLAVDWFEEDDIVDEIEMEVEEPIEVVENESKEESSVFGEEIKVNESTEEIEEKPIETRKVLKKVKVFKTVLRPCQTEYFDNTRAVIGEISEKIDYRHLKNKVLN